MTDLIAFLGARLDEDERIARAVTADDWGDADTQARYEWEDLPDAAFAHAKQHNPARVLREVEAKRAIVGELTAAWRRKTAALAEYDAWLRAGADPHLLPGFGVGSPNESLGPSGHLIAGLERAVRLLATLYSNHPDYRDEWKP